MTIPTDDPPTEALPVVPPVPHDDYFGAAAYHDGMDDDGMGDADPDADLVEDQYSEPRRRSRLTTVLVVLLLIAVGFLGGVYVGRMGSAATVQQRNGGPAATSTARPGAAGGARVGGGAFRAF